LDRNVFLWRGNSARLLWHLPAAAGSSSQYNTTISAHFRANSTESFFSDATLAPSLTLAPARKIASSASQGYVGDVQILQTSSGAAVAAIQNERIVGAARFLMMEKRGGQFRFSTRGQLDTLTDLSRRGGQLSQC